MDYQLYVLLAPYLGLVVVFLLLVVARRLRFPGARGLLWLICSALGFLVANYLELVLPVEGWKILSAKLSNVFVSLLPITWLAFVFDFIGRGEWKRVRRFWPALVPSVVNTALVMTNEGHHLIWSSVRFVPMGTVTALQVTHGVLYMLFMVLTYVIFLAGIVLIIREYARGRHMYRRQLFWIIVGILFAMAVNMLYVFRVFPWLRKDYTPFGFAVAAVFYAMGIFRHRFLDLAPASRSRLFEALQDGIVVLDEGMRIIDMNGTAMSVIGLTDADLGSSISSRALLLPLLESPADANGKVEQDITISVQDEPRRFSAILSRIRLEEGGRNVSMLILHDVTERVKLFEEIKTLRGIVPICASCKKVRTDKGFWQSVEAYVSAHSYAEFTHGLCPECMSRLYPDPDRRVP